MERKELFFSLLNEALVKEGFEYKKSIKGFSKTENNIEYKYTFEIWPHFMKIDPSFDILIKQIEDIKKKAWGKLYFKVATVGEYKRDMYRSKFIPIDFESISWTDTEEAVRKAVKKEIEFYYAYLKDFYMKFSDISNIDKFLNSEPYEHRVLCYVQENTYCLAIIVAKLNNNPNLKNLIEFYKPLYFKQNQGNLTKFELLESYLLSMP
jgi:hypothetical protein